MWTVVYVAPDQVKAEKVKERLSVEGFMVKLRPAGASKTCQGTIEVLVPEVEAREAIETLNDSWARGAC